MATYFRRKSKHFRSRPGRSPSRGGSRRPGVPSGNRSVGDTVQSPALLGDLETILGVDLTLSRTSDNQPENQYNWPNGDPGTITLEHTDGTTSGPFPTTGEWGEVLKPGIWKPISQAQNSEGDLVVIGGQIEIIGGVSYATSSGNLKYTAANGVAYLVGVA